MNKGARNSRVAERIIRVSMEKFTRQGFESTSVDEICKEAGVSKPVLYYYFGDKKGLFLTLHLKTMQETLIPYIEKARSIKDPLQRIEFIIKEFTQIVVNHEELKILIHNTLSMYDDSFKAVRERWRDHYLLLKETIEELQERSIASNKARPSFLALFVLGFMCWIPYWWDYSRGGGEEISKAAWDFVREGLGI